ncbi:MAG: UDP-4-amino-4,6-dideoxy-N-acetyl-beta-L-altrosamine transaminase [Bacteroidetes bacterium]|nr:MAG: UDP-4-amino-4,6-dideoxy-N-acetyl-beta-L-altrosamine transaminase [Bacteroidota bacterium]
MPIPYGKQQVTEADIEAVTRVLRADYWTQGPELPAFEAEFAAYVGARYAVAVSSGTAALHLSALALGVQPGPQVLVPALTFVASANCVAYAGGKVDFVDIDPDTGLMSLAAARTKLEAAPAGTYRGIIPVDYAGLPVDMAAWRALADEFGLWLLEDSCHAPGGAFRSAAGTWSRCGSGDYAELAIFSFHPVKHIATGEGGMITTQDEGLYRTLLDLRNHGITRERDRFQHGGTEPGGWYYEMQALGYNYRLSAIHAALGRSQLSRAEENLARRRALAARYDAAFSDSPVQIIRPAGDQAHAYHLYVVRIADRAGLYEHLRAQEIFAQLHYNPAHLQPWYRQQGWREGDLPETEAFAEQALSLPLYPDLTEAEQDKVIAEVLGFCVDGDA